MKKYQNQLKDVQRDLDDARQSRDDLANQVKDNEKKLKILEADFVQMQEDLSSAERARRAIETERDELLEELNNGASGKQALSEEKKRFEAQLAALEEELEEERTQTELMMEKVGGFKVLIIFALCLVSNTYLFINIRGWSFSI